MTTQELTAKWNPSLAHNGAADIMTEKGSHRARLLMDLGRRLPRTKVHAQYWDRNGCNLDMISKHELLPLVAFCEMVGVTPDFKLTKSGSFARLDNNAELNAAIKTYYR